MCCLNSSFSLQVRFLFSVDAFFACDSMLPLESIVISIKKQAICESKTAAVMLYMCHKCSNVLDLPSHPNR